MCLLLKQPAGHKFSKIELADFYDYNPDGIGVMWSEDSEIHVVKVVPNTVEDIYEFFDEHVGDKECAIHFRWRTHGDTDLANCHPYEVFGENDEYPLYLMHNGVLHTGNAADTTRSDTYHYIQNIIRPALLADPTQFTAPWFKALIEDHIGNSNKFVIMDAYGNTATFNENMGVNVGNVWYSNTYAWTAPSARPKYNSNYNGHYAKTPPLNYGVGSGYGFGGYGANDYLDDFDTPAKVAPIKSTVPATASASTEWQNRVDAWSFADDFLETLFQWGMDDAAAALSKYTLKEAYLEDSEFCLNVLEDISAGLMNEEDIVGMFKEQSYAPVANDTVRFEALGG